MWASFYGRGTPVLGGKHTKLAAFIVERKCRHSFFRSKVNGQGVEFSVEP